MFIGSLKTWLNSLLMDDVYWFCIGFGPRDDKKYDTGFLQAAINDAVGNTTRVACNTKVEGGRQLSQIWMCVDKDVSELIKCPVYPTFACPDEIFFETFTADMMHSTELSFNPIEMPISISDDEWCAFHGLGLCGMCEWNVGSLLVLFTGSNGMMKKKV